MTVFNCNGTWAPEQGKVGACLPPTFSQPFYFYFISQRIIVMLLPQCKKIIIIVNAIFSQSRRLKNTIFLFAANYGVASFLYTPRRPCVCIKTVLLLQILKIHCAYKSIFEGDFYNP